MPRPGPCLALLALVGCAHVDLSTMRAVEQVDPLSADPGGMRVILTAPPALGVRPGSVTLALRSDDGTCKLAHDVELAHLQLKDGQHVFRIAPADLPAVRAAQVTVRDMERADPYGNAGSLSAGFEPCLTGVPLNPRAPVSVALVLEEGGPVLPLIRDLPAGRYVKEIESRAGVPLPVCETDSAPAGDRADGELH